MSDCELAVSSEHWLLKIDGVIIVLGVTVLTLRLSKGQICQDSAQVARVYTARLLSQNCHWLASRPFLAYTFLVLVLSVCL